MSYQSTAGGGGSVTEVSVVTANGVTGSVANPTTTPAITMGGAGNCYRTIHNASVFILDGITANTFNLPADKSVSLSVVGQSVGGTNASVSINPIYIAAADYPTVGALATKLRVSVNLLVNDVAPTGNFTIGLYPITRPATSGAGGQMIITLGTVVAGSTVLFTAPAADSMANGN